MIHPPSELAPVYIRRLRVQGNFSSIPAEPYVWLTGLTYQASFVAT